MQIEARAISVLSEAESSLRQLTAEAAAAGDYSGILKIASWAKAIHELVTASTPSKGAPAPSRPLLNGSTSKSRRPADDGYPRFFRRGDELVRVAWSKREKKEYQHKAASDAVKALTTALTTAGKGGRLFTTDEVLPIRHGVDGSEIPNYQAYVCIAWLKQTGLIDQHGRQGYSVPRPEEFATTVETMWRSLPQH